jgi:hypothetical protein
MAQKEELEQQGQAQQTRTAERVETGAVEEALSILDAEGGFGLIATTVDEAENMDPDSAALKEIFLKESENQKARKQLKNRLKYLVALLQSQSNVGDMIEQSNATAEQSGKLLNENLKKALDATQKLEANYRAVADFYRNAGGDKPIKNVTIVNASLEQAKDLDNPKVLNLVSEELTDKYDRLDLMNNYGLMVVPGSLGKKEIIDEWARRAHDAKAMLVTDFHNLSSADQVMKLFEKSKLTGAEAFRANVMMTCNWLVGRDAVAEAGEKEPLYVPPAGALAGLIYSTNISQVAAGNKFGGLRGAKGCRFDIRAGDISNLADMGLVPMVYEFGKVQAFSSKTLFNGTNIGLQTYSVVRTFDWLTKGMMDYLNRMLFQNISVNMEMDINKEISRFLDKCQREHKIIEKFGAVTVKRDPNQKDRVFVSANIMPFFPAKNFVLRLDGRGGEDPEWESKVE